MVLFPGIEEVTGVGPTVKIPGMSWRVSVSTEEDWGVPPCDTGPRTAGVGTASDGEKEG